MTTDKLSIETVEEVLIKRLKKGGMGNDTIAGFMRSLKGALKEYPEMTHGQLDQKMKSLGWEDIEFDYRTWELALAALDHERRYI